MNMASEKQLAFGTLEAAVDETKTSSSKTVVIQRKNATSFCKNLVI